MVQDNIVAHCNDAGVDINTAVRTLVQGNTLINTAGVQLLMVAKRTADLAPALVLGAQLIMGALFGLLGLMLADPLVAMLKVALERQSEKNEGT